jgi:hypothetical protein
LRAAVTAPQSLRKDGAIASTGERKLRAMTMRRKFSWRRPAAALTIAACLGGMSPLAAHAQASLSPGEVEHAIEASGYEVVGPIVRHGATYVVDVIGEGDVSEQFIIDAHDGRLLRRYPGRPGVRRHAANPNGPVAPLTNFFDGLFGGADDTAPLPPPPDDEFYDKPRPKPHIKRPVPTAQQAKAPAATAPATAPPPTAPTTTAPPVAATTPAAAAAAPAANAPPKNASPKPNDVQVVPLE